MSEGTVTLWSGNFATVRRLRLEYNFLWVYPLLDAERGINELPVLGNVDRAVVLLCLGLSVFVERGLVAAVRAELRGKGRGNG